ncbi:MAG: sigma-70 family RNA polymerase sigma factor, partial [Leptolyngbyaceae cyanobacterium SM1_1_3]|nr:sigma-70 family RNA polymerase sigma factor [Leptolyngbyaceae cyanobacterium SM1_1_3]
MTLELPSFPTTHFASNASELTATLEVHHLRKSYGQMRHITSDIAEYENVLEAVTETTDESESISEILQGVGEREKKILSLMHGQGYTAREVGTQLGMKESAVKVA